MKSTLRNPLSATGVAAGAPDGVRVSPAPREAPGTRTVRAFDKVAGEIRRHIKEGRLKAGDRLSNERDLAGELGVSRNTVREAIRSLENGGLLTLRRGPGGGAFVACADGGTVRNGMSDLLTLGLIEPGHLREAQAIIGTAVARLAAQRRSYADLHAIRENIEQTLAAGKAKDEGRRLQLQFAFHRLLANATYNPALVVLTDAVIGLNEPLVQAAGLRTIQSNMSFRRRIFEHLENGDGDGAAIEMQKQLEATQRFYTSRLNRRAPRPAAI